MSAEEWLARWCGTSRGTGNFPQVPGILGDCFLLDSAVSCIPQLAAKIRSRASCLAAWHVPSAASASARSRRRRRYSRSMATMIALRDELPQDPWRSPECGPERPPQHGRRGTSQRARVDAQIVAARRARRRASSRHEQRRPAEAARKAAAPLRPSARKSSTASASTSRARHQRIRSRNRFPG